jgi:hypothetical protein
MNVTEVNRLTEQVAQLPPERQIEVFDFVQFLLHREKQAQRGEDAKAWENLMLAQAETFADWDNTEDEVWDNVPAI